MERRDRKIQREQGRERARPTPIEMELVLFERAGMRKTSVEFKNPFSWVILPGADNLIKFRHWAVDLHTQSTHGDTSNFQCIEMGSKATTEDTCRLETKITRYLVTEYCTMYTVCSRFLIIVLVPNHHSFLKFFKTSFSALFFIVQRVMLVITLTARLYYSCVALSDDTYKLYNINLTSSLLYFA